MIKQSNQGFTLIEMLISIVVIGSVLAITSGLFAQTSSLERKTERLTQKDFNARTAQAIVAVADVAANGRLSAPITNENYYSAFVEDTETSPIIIREALSRGLSIDLLANNGKASPQQRVYQVLRGLTSSETTRGFAGPLVTLTYDVGVVYVSGCSMSDETCHPNADTDIAGFSPLLTTDNVASFELTEPDYGLVRLSSLNSQRRLLKETMRRVDEVQSALTSFYTSRYLAGDPDSTKNYYPGAVTSSDSDSTSSNDADADADQDASTQDASDNDGCAQDWINLNDTSATGNGIMYQIGLQPAALGQTAWGGQIQYCPTYFASGSGDPNLPPHNAALRIHKSVSTAATPSSSTNSVVFGI